MTSRIYEILDAATTMYRKGAEIVEREITAPALVETESGEPVGVADVPRIHVTEIFAMPHVADAGDEELVDLHFVMVGVKRAIAESLREDLITELRQYPEPERLAGGPSYIESGAVLGSQDYALRLYALGETLGLWKVITPERMRITGPAADELAGQGFVMITGWSPE